MPATYFSTKCHCLLPTALPGWWWVGKRGETGEGSTAAGSCPWKTAVSQKVNEIKMIRLK